MTIFLFVLTSNWLGILPGFGTIGRFEPADEFIHHKEDAAEKAGKEIDLSTLKVHVFEGEGSLAYLPFGSVDNEITAEQYHHDGVEEGQRAGVIIPFLRSANTDINTPLALAIIAMVMVHFWGLSALGLGHVGKFLNFKEGPIGLFVGLLEGVSELSRVISFTFRLFGNIFAGEGAPDRNGVPDTPRRSHTVLGAGVVRRFHSGFHLRHADARIRLDCDDQPR